MVDATRSRRRAWVPGVLAMAVVGVISCASTPNGAPPVPSCYYFQEGEATTAFRLPEGVRLTDEPLEGWPAIMQRGDVKVAVTLTRLGEADYPFGYWLEEPGDSVEIGYPAGGGIVLELAVQSGALDGTARSYSDVLRYGDEPSASARALPVRLERGDCR